MGALKLGRNGCVDETINDGFEIPSVEFLARDRHGCEHAVECWPMTAAISASLLGKYR
jgi:hypothetical protein